VVDIEKEHMEEVGSEKLSMMNEDNLEEERD
jgi:hypothetical protein